MNRLSIVGVIASAGDAKTAGEKTFTPEDLDAFLDGNGGAPFEAIINSPGGSVEAGFKIYNKLKGVEVTTIAEKANSIASVIFLAGKNRKVYEDAEMIIHNAWLDPGALAGEKLNAHSIQAMADFFSECDAKILDVYTAHAGADKATALLALMAQDANLGSDRAIELGLATEVIGSKARAFSFQNRVVTYSSEKNEEIETQTNKLKTEMETNEKLNAFEKALKGLMRAFHLSAKNMTVTTSEGVELYIPEGDGDGGPVGKAAFIAEDGAPTETPAPQGSHTLSDGSVIVVGEGGIITEASAAVDPEALKSEFEEKEKEMEGQITALEDEKKELQNQVKNLTEAQAKTEKTAKTLEAQFNELKNQVIGDPEKKKEPKKLSKEDWDKLSTSERIRIAAMNKAGN